MASRRIKITYIPAQFRVRTEFSKADCIASPLPPEDLLERAKAKLKREKKLGKVDFYRVFKTRLVTTWERLRDSNEPLDTIVAVTLATGAPPMPGLLVTRPTAETADDPDCIGQLTITATPEAVQDWGFKLFKLTVGRRLRDLDITRVPDPALLQTAWKRATWGMPIQDLQIHAVPALNGENGDDDHGNHGDYKIQLQPQDGQVLLQVLNIRNIFDRQLLPQLLEEIQRSVTAITKSTGVAYDVQTEDLIRELRSANRGPERYGMDLPFMWLVAIAIPPKYRNQIAKKTKPKTLSSKSKDVAVKPLSELIKFSITADRMRASITHFDRLVYKSKPTFDTNDWRQFLAEHGITHGFDEETLTALVTLYAQRGDLTNMDVAIGKAPTAGKAPFLVAAYKESPLTFDPAAADAPQTNIRDMQQRRLVRPGQVVAAFRFKVPAEPGFDISGKELHAPLPALPAIKIGDHIAQNDPLLFHAMVDGVPEVTADSVGLQRALIFKGDVNLTSGNIDFTGPVEINGSIDEGSRVIVHGDLIVHGMIHGALVKVAGNITVDGGILTNNNGSIRASGNIQAGFIENSQIAAGGNITVNKSIIASRVDAHGSITVADPEGKIIGGSLACLNNLIVANLGRSSGARTKVAIGGDPKSNRRLQILANRLVQLQNSLAAKQSGLKEYRKKSEQQLTAKQAETKDILDEQIVHCERLITAVQAKLERSKAEASENPDAKIEVSKLLSANCQISVGEQAIPVPSELAGVLITGKRKGGSFIVALQEDPEAKQAG